MELSDLIGRPLTYDAVGATVSGDPPAGYRWVQVSARIGVGRPRFEQAAESVMRYGMLRGAGVAVTASTDVARVGSLVLGRLGPFAAPCRVVRVVDEPNLRGFAYGTLPGHPVTGEELFAVRYDPASESVYSTVAAFSRPDTWWAKLGSPALSVVQKLVTKRYLAAV